jgi:hypothetical protein
MDSKDLVNRFIYHAPKEGQPEKYELMRSIALSFSAVINDMVPDGREKSLAITHLEEVVFWANAGIARNNAAEEG